MRPKSKDFVIELINQLEENKKSLVLSYKQYKKDSIEAPSAMESHSDVSRVEFGKLADSAMKRISDIDKTIKILKEAAETENKKTGVASLIERDGKFILIVPDGAGGIELKKNGIAVKTISINSPIGIKILSEEV